MSRFRDELKVIPPLAWILALAVYISSATLLFRYGVLQDPKLGKWPLAGQILFAYGVFLSIFALVLLIGYVNADAKRRGMRYVMWTLLAIFIPDGIGIILYFVLRDPMPKKCPACGTMVKTGVFCPQCGTAVQPTCPSCKKGIEPGWSHCPHCGTALPVAPSRVA
jgi:Double zinc ribbon